jgi:hypothetical protein
MPVIADTDNRLTLSLEPSEPADSRAGAGNDPERRLRLVLAG